MTANADLTVSGRSSTTSSALPLASVLVDDRAGVVGNSRTLGMELLQRATQDDYDRWLATALAAGGLRSSGPVAWHHPSRRHRDR